MLFVFGNNGTVIQACNAVDLLSSFYSLKGSISECCGPRDPYYLILISKGRLGGVFCLGGLHSPDLTRQALILYSIEELLIIAAR